MRLAHVVNNRVKNIIKGDIAKYPSLIDVTKIQCGIGWLANDDGTFTNDIVIVESKIIGLDELMELLPDLVLVELIDIANNVSGSESVAKRAAVERVRGAMRRGAKIDAYSNKMTNLMTKLVNHTSLTPAQATAIVDTLRE